MFIFVQLNEIRKKVHYILLPLINFLVRTGITPNVITSLSIILTFPACYFLILHKNLIFLSLFVFISFLDLFDGAIAENANMKTKFGAFYDAFADRIVEGSIYFSIAIAYEDLAILSFLALIMSYLTSYVAAWEKSVKYVGLGSRAGRIIILIISFAFNFLYYGLIIISLLSAYTILIRLHLMKTSSKYIQE